MRISEFKQTARTSLSGYWAETALLTFIVFLIGFLPTLFLEIYAAGDINTWSDPGYTPPGYVLLIECVYSLILIPLSVGVVWFYLSLVREEQPRITRPFSMYRQLNTSLNMIGTSLLLFIFTLLWMLLLIVPGIIKAIAYSQTFYLLKDHPEYTALQAITESKRRMKGYKWKFFLLNLSFIGWLILGALPLGIGLFWVFPYISSADAAFYEEIIKDRKDVSSEEASPADPDGSI